MPAFDGTGPAGLGPRTGWGRGGCAAFGGGMRRGFGRRGGFCGFFARQQLAPSDERSLLQQEAEAASAYLKELQARLKELGEK